jgi:hypothetical protein
MLGKEYNKMRVKCHLDGARQGEEEDKGRILEEGRGAVLPGAEETWGVDECSRGEVDWKRNMEARSLQVSEG